MKIEQHTIGYRDNKEVKLFNLTNQSGLSIAITNYGGTITSIKAPDKHGKFEEITLGFDDPAAYWSEKYLANCPYFGCVIGRVGNRIAKGKFVLNGQNYTLAINNGENHLHGGLKAFDKVVWDAEASEDQTGAKVSMTYTSPDMEEGYPGNLAVKFSYTLTDANELIIDYEAETDKATPVNLTNHTYFNLSGCKRNILDHDLQILSNRITEINDALIPTGKIVNIKQTDFNFNELRPIGERIENVPGGYDNNYVLDNEQGELICAALVIDPESGRTLEVFTTEPGVQLYTGNFLDGSYSRGGFSFTKHTAFCLETQHYPDSVNHREFPSIILEEDEIYTQTTIYKFGVEE